LSDLSWPPLDQLAKVWEVAGFARWSGGRARAWVGRGRTGEAMGRSSPKQGADICSRRRIGNEHHMREEGERSVMREREHRL